MISEDDAELGFTSWSCQACRDLLYGMTQSYSKAATTEESSTGAMQAWDDVCALHIHVKVKLQAWQYHRSQSTMHSSSSISHVHT